MTKFFALLFVGLLSYSAQAEVYVDVDIGHGRHKHRPHRPHRHRHHVHRESSRFFIAGHTRVERVLVEPGHYMQEWVPAEVEVYYENGVRRERVIKEGYYRRYWVEDRYETREIWVPGRWTFFIR